MKPPKVYLRPWEVGDTSFSLKVRNHPELMKWFRQDAPIKTAAQRAFIKQSKPDYYGYVIEADKQPVGLCAVTTSGEFSIAILPLWQRKGIAYKAMQILEAIARVYDKGMLWSEVFVTNPALSFYLHKCGFKAVSVQERKYFKEGIGQVDVVRIEKAL